MEIKEFKNIINNYSKKINILLNEEQIEKFYKYMNLLIEWNKKINLTAIIEPKEIILKHFIDSLTINKYIKDNSKIADVGTGAGFPGIPLKIIRPDIQLVLVDSLNKRINFLNEVIEQLNLKNIETIHIRIEEFGQNTKYREKFDYSTARAVANLSTLSEYLLPVVKVGGQVICMKGSNIQDEINQSKKALSILGGTLNSIEEFKLAETENTRNIILIDKIKNTPNKYPRKAGLPSKDPIK